MPPTDPDLDVTIPVSRATRRQFASQTSNGAQPTYSSKNMGSRRTKSGQTVANQAGQVQLALESGPHALRRLGPDGVNFGPTERPPRPIRSDPPEKRT